MGTCGSWGTTRICVGTPFVFIYINYFDGHIRKIANPVLFPDDTSSIITNTDAPVYQTNISKVMTETMKSFQSNLNYNDSFYTVPS